LVLGVNVRGGKPRAVDAGCSIPALLKGRTLSVEKYSAGNSYLWQV
jgi:hypothetical protein